MLPEITDMSTCDQAHVHHMLCAYAFKVLCINLHMYIISKLPK